MKLTLILPKCYDRKEDKGDTLVLPPLNLPTIAALTPPHVDVRIIDDRLEEIDYDEEADLVGITCITETAGRAYDIAARFRERGIPVILGGLHPT
ncbi:MAG TPA: B12-binding domain-containing radical SAM protein, partial [Blastocatellia bacterium]|nr:B12-binding domain-containing radical SAM protein [Blastocatellia bacterium]